MKLTMQETHRADDSVAYVTPAMAHLRRLIALNVVPDDAHSLAEKENVAAAFWSSVTDNPLIEELTDSNKCRLTFIYQGNSDIATVDIVGAVVDPSMQNSGSLTRIEGTDVWYLTIDNLIANDTRVTYQYVINGALAPDPHYKYKIDGHSGSATDQYIVDLPHAKEQPYVNRASLATEMEKLKADGRLVEGHIDFSESRFLCDEKPYMDDAKLSDLTAEQRLFRQETNQGSIRKYWIHFPPGYDPNHRPPYKVLVHLDGEETIKCMKLPAIMETAPVEPTISIFVDVGNRNIEYGCGKDAELFADFLAREFMPKLRNEYLGLSREPGDTTIAGFSMGGHAAVQIATRHPEVFGNVVGQSSAFWMGPQNLVSGEFESTNEGLLTKLQHQHFPEAGWCADYPSEAAKDMCFYLTVGSLETAGFHLTPSGDLGVGGISLVRANETFSTFLKSKGIACEFEKYSGDHCFAEWQGGLVDGLLKIRQFRREHSVAEMIPNEHMLSVTTAQPARQNLSTTHEYKERYQRAKGVSEQQVSIADASDEEEHIEDENSPTKPIRPN